MLATTHSNRSELLETALVYLLCAIAFCMPLVPIAGAVLIGLAILVAAYKMIYEKRWEIHRGPGIWLLFGFIMCSLGSTIQSPIPMFSTFNWLYEVGSYMTVYFLTITYIDTVEKRNWVLWAMLTAAVCSCLYGLVQFSQLYGAETQDWVDPSRFPLLKRRMFSTLQNPNLMGAYLLEIMAIMGSLTLAAMSMRKTPKEIHSIVDVTVKQNSKADDVAVGRTKKFTVEIMQRLTGNVWIASGLSLFFLLCLVLTYSRGIWVSMAVMVLFWGLFVERRLLLSLLVIPGIMFFYHGGIAKRLWSLFGHHDTSVSLRYALWDSTTYMIEEHPLLGIGWGAYWKVYPEYNYFIQDPNTIIYHAHNMYLHLMATIGIPGFTCFMAFLLYIAWRCIRLPQDGERMTFVFRYGIPAMILAILVSGVTDYELFSYQVSVVFWQILAIGVSVLQKRHLQCN